MRSLVRHDTAGDTVVRRTTQEDIHSLVDFINDRASPGGLSRITPELAGKWIGTGTSVVATVDGRIIGHATSHLCEPVAVPGRMSGFEIKSVAVDESSQRTGLSAVLVSASVYFAKQYAQHTGMEGYSFFWHSGNNARGKTLATSDSGLGMREMLLFDGERPLMSVVERLPEKLEHDVKRLGPSFVLYSGDVQTHLYDLYASFRGNGWKLER